VTGKSVEEVKTELKQAIDEYVKKNKM